MGKSETEQDSKNGVIILLSLIFMTNVSKFFRKVVCTNFHWRYIDPFVWNNSAASYTEKVFS